MNLRESLYLWSIWALGKPKNIGLFCYIPVYFNYVKSSYINHNFSIYFFGPFLLKGILTPERYNHFLKLHVAIRILASPSYLTNNELAHDLLVEFVEEFRVIVFPLNVIILSILFSIYYFYSPFMEIISWFSIYIIWSI